MSRYISMRKIELSIKGIIKSALVNLSKEYAENINYVSAFFEILDYYLVKDIALEESAKIQSNEKEKLIEAIKDSDDTDDIVLAIRRTIEKKEAKKLFQIISKEIISKIDHNDLLFQKRTSTVEVENIGDFFDLNDAEKRLILFFYAWNKTGEFEDFCQAECHNLAQSKMYSFIATAIGCKEKEIALAIKNLREKNIIENARFVLPVLTEEIRNYILEFDGSSIAEKFSKKMKIDKTFKLSSFPIERDDIEIIKKMLKSTKPRHILLYGEPGAGKSEFVKALAKNLHKDIYIPNRESKNGELTHTKINATIFASSRSKSIALIDEADEFLETSFDGFFAGLAGKGNNERKGAVNLLMDDAKASIIWITNSIEGIDKSTRRRFAYSLRFDGISDSQKEIIIKNSVAKNKISKQFIPQMKTLSKRYGLSTAGIGLVLDKATSISDNNSELAYNIDKIAKAHYELISNKKSISEEITVDERFDPSILNIDFPIDAISQTLSNYKIATENGVKAPMSFLLSGVAGTGKTQLGRFIANQLGKELILKRMSEISNCYIGETEKNIRKMFLEATRNNAVLMIDEADSLFYDRRNARQSWEISQTNEILAQMEIFNGVFICTTNLAENMDPASMRRFNWKVKFSAPTHEGRIKLYSRYFLENKKPSCDVEKSLYSMDGLCPGDFKAVWQKTRFLTDKPDSLVLDALKTELSYKKYLATTSIKLGFC
ncbi:MAG: ATP-binding protein [Opitutales bacterium]|nr:ATP-binding protein [Opitutales bacterium]